MLISDGSVLYQVGCKVPQIKVPRWQDAWGVIMLGYFEPGFGGHFLIFRAVFGEMLLLHGSMEFQQEEHGRK